MKKCLRESYVIGDNYNDRKNVSQDHFFKDFEVWISFFKNRIVYFYLYYFITINQEKFSNLWQNNLQMILSIRNYLYLNQKTKKFISFNTKIYS